MNACLLISMALVFSPGYGRTGEGCIEVQTEPELCPECLGVSACVCLYAGAACPSVEAGCYARLKIKYTGDFTVTQSLEPCAWSQPCKPNIGSTCYPVTNPCVKYGQRTDYGTMIVSYQDTAGC